MFNEWAVLRDDQIIRKRWIVRAVTPKLFAAVESSGRWRRDFHDDLRIDDHVAMFIEKLNLSAYNYQVRVGVESFLRVTPSRQRPAPNFHILCERLAARAFQLRAYFAGQIGADRSVLRAFASHRINLAVQIFVT